MNMIHLVYIDGEPVVEVADGNVQEREQPIQLDDHHRLDPVCDCLGGGESLRVQIWMIKSIIITWIVTWEMGDAVGRALLLRQTSREAAGLLFHNNAGCLQKYEQPFYCPIKGAEIRVTVILSKSITEGTEETSLYCMCDRGSPSKAIGRLLKTPRDL